VRLAMIFLLTWFFLYLFCWVGYYGLTPYPVFEMSWQLMFPVCFLGCLAFLVSTIVKNGNGTAVVMIIIGVFLMILADSLDKTLWNVFHNPYSIPDKMNEMIWSRVSQNNRWFLSIASTVCLLWGLMNLQRRETFLK